MDEKNLKKMIDFCHYLGINAVLELENFENRLAENLYLYPEKIITINKNLSTKDKIIILSHEIGHFVNRSKNEHWVKMSELAMDMESSFPKNRVEFHFFNAGELKEVKISSGECILKEEQLAWEIALDTLKLLKIKFDTKRFNQHKKNGLASYQKAHLSNLKKPKKIIRLEHE